MALACGYVLASTPGWEGPPVVGTSVSYSKAQPDEKMTAKFYANKEGFRSEMDMPGNKLIIIQNNKAGKCWHVIESAKIYQEVAINKKTGECASIMGEEMEASSDTSPADDIPCDGYTKKEPAGDDTVIGRAANKWNCSGGAEGASATQWHDKKLKMLLKEETSMGDVQNVTELTEKSFAKDLLEPPKGMKRVSADEFRKTLLGSMMPPGMPQE